MTELSQSLLGEICDAGGGEIRTGPFGSQLHQSDYRDEGIPVVMPKDIMYGKVCTNGIARISDEDAVRLSQHKLIADDIVYGRRGDIGRHALVTDREAGWLCGTGCLRIRLGRGPVHPMYLHYYLDQEDMIGWIRNQAIGATMPNLNTAILRSVPIKYPTRATQRKIAAILSAYDDLIENNLRRVRILEEMAQMIYREWFVNFRFPGHEKVKMVKSELGMIPEGWEVVGLLEIADIVRENVVPENHPEETFVHFSIPAFDESRQPTLERGQQINSNKYLVIEGSVLVSKLNPRIKRVWMPTLTYPHRPVCSTEFLVLLPSNKIPRGFLYALCDSREFNERFAALAMGTSTSHQRVKPDDLKKLKVVRPPDQLLKRFDEVLPPIQEMPDVLRFKNLVLRRTRDLLLPRLISGEIDVDDLNINTEGIEP